MGGIDRSFQVAVGATYDSTNPVIINLHGYGSSADQQARYSRLPEIASERGFVVVTPDGAGTPQSWNNQQSPDAADDLQFVRDLIAHLDDALCVDTDRIYVAGISNGSAFAQRLACELPDQIAGVAAVAALVYPYNCTSDTPVPVIAFHGTGDTCVPYEGGLTTCGRGGLPVPPVEVAAENWARHNGCALEAPATEQVTEHVGRLTYEDGCAPGAPVVLYTVEGGGHTWPGAADVGRLGATTQEIDASELIVEFFEAHP